MSPILKFWPKLLEKKKIIIIIKLPSCLRQRAEMARPKFFLLLVLLFFPSLRQPQREAKEAQGKGKWSRAKKKL